MEGVANDCHVGIEIPFLHPEFLQDVASPTMKFNADTPGPCTHLFFCHMQVPVVLA
jgi:hypothetical protein